MRTRMNAVKRAGSVFRASPHLHSWAESACQCRNPPRDDSETKSTKDSCSSPSSSTCVVVNDEFRISHQDSNNVWTGRWCNAAHGSNRCDK